MLLDPQAHLALHLQNTQLQGLDRERRAGAQRGRRTRWNRRHHHATVATAPDRWPTPNPDAFRALLGRLAESVVVVTGHDDVGRPRGLTISSFSSVSLTPPLVLFCVGVQSSTWAAIAGQGGFAVNVLSSDQHEVAARFASPEDRFAGIPHEYAPNGIPVLGGGLATLLCTVENGLRAGDHEVVIGRVVGARDGNRIGSPLAYHAGRYASVAALPAAAGGSP